MKKPTLPATLFSLLFAAQATWAEPAENKRIYNVGFGAIFNGLGMSTGTLDGSSLRYLSFGCLTGLAGEKILLDDCGVGVGLMDTNILSDNGKHGLGIHFGVYYNAKNWNSTHTEYSENFDKVEAFIGFPYQYYFNGIGHSGSSLGISPIYGRFNGENKTSIYLNWGYRF